MTSITLTERAQGLLVGLASGDAIGTTVEFKPRGSFVPLTDMVGGGPFALEAGQWTDDTSMALCLGESLKRCRGFDPVDQMNRYVNWHEHGYMSSNGRCFDIGNATSAALQRYLSTRDPYAGSTHEMSAGNGCLMRLGPVPIATLHLPHSRRAEIAANSSRTTHAAAECVQATALFSEVLRHALLGATKQDVVTMDWPHAHLPGAPLAAIIAQTWKVKTREEIKGSGYVIHAFEAALWCFWHTDTYKDAVLMAANLGDDADTTAAICGQLAGAFYGIEAIPQAWRARITMSEEIHELAAALVALAQEMAEVE